MSADPTESDVPAGLEPWCKTLRGEQAWRMEIPGGEAALVRWKALRDQHSVTGMWPVLLGADMSIIDQMTWRVSILAEQAPGIPEVSAATPAPELFVQWLGDPAHDDYLGDVPRHLAKLEADQATIRARLEARPDHAAVRAVKEPKVQLALVPAKGGWELPALLAWPGGEGLDIGGTEHLSRGLYHSGLTHDPLLVMRHLIDVERVRSIVVAGYSLGGNLTLKLAGDLGADAPPELKAVCAVSPTMDLALCVDALERRSNVLYQFNFMRNLRARMRRKAALFPDVYDVSRLRGVWTVRGFDDAFTAPLNGFGTASRYYQEASSLRVVERASVPTLILTAANDPFVPPEQFRRPEVESNPHVRVVKRSLRGPRRLLGRTRHRPVGHRPHRPSVMHRVCARG